MNLVMLNPPSIFDRTLLCLALGTLIFGLLCKNLPLHNFQIAHAAASLHQYSLSEYFWRADLKSLEGASSNSNSPDFIEYWCSESNLGVVLQQQAKYSETEKVLSDALERSKHVQTPGYFVVPTSMLILASLYKSEGKVALSQYWIKQASQADAEHIKKSGESITQQPAAKALPKE
ncbi:MAG: hypothetical protein P4L53_06770 [Candidatus Obscuribacterales bacterium]|nr:hypothetical protein [Candidatus Obscuribacterales bacterium]